VTAWFVADVHLDQSRPDIAAAFAAFLDETVAGADALYVLGDLFESWIGDDDPDPVKSDAIRGLRRLSDAGTACYFAHGNRDFLAGEDFARAAGLTLLPEEAVITLGQERVLVMHGDSLCTDDQQYMAVRQQVRDPQWQASVLALPVPAREALAAQARAQSATDMATKAEDIMDVNQDAVIAALARHDVRRLIHGHTHRPAWHRFEINGKAHSRHVLGDWYDQGRVLSWDGADFAETTLSVADRCGN
jgi:UDP-2,3-diacylglucosamine hydrolase